MEGVLLALIRGFILEDQDEGLNLILDFTIGLDVFLEFFDEFDLEWHKTFLTIVCKCI